MTFSCCHCERSEAISRIEGETMPQRIIMPSQVGEEIIEVAREVMPSGFELVVVPFGTAEFAAALKDTDYYIGSPRFLLGPEFYHGAPKLKLVQLFSAGYNTLDLEAARAARVPICNNGGSNATAVAEHAMLLMLAVARKLTWQHEGVVSGRWRGNDFNSTRLYELKDKTLGIIGLGNIGKKVARRAKAFDMRVRYYDIHRLTGDQEDALGVRFALFPELLKTSDIVTLHVPLDRSTHNLIGEREFALMKPTAILVNTCRGPVVDEKALYIALRDEKILGAGIDVMREEPPQPDHELFTLKNAIYTPHAAGPSWEAWKKGFRNCFDNCERIARGQRPFWIVPELRE
jgi:phosphoglycerate dehydrogenase-like enzyme